ncbi:hypothetical protein CLPU_4c00580 [Gottschalkia purinilytica]|uniref:DUF2087 domain-containing protein n=1 Tax=Gottschalkia purinilytica TaxID=1503 RepID=A0A0L0WC21_GOTPU|nr:DUF2087 domain-containing protein [Gottschalkia purinilytica]KNF09012.1 hypothetical protein CLPU_4c00580 [Gottschalkia purinilytica]
MTNNKKESSFNNAKNKKVVIKTTMDTIDGHLFQLEHDSLVTLQEIAKLFKIGLIYKEKEVNQILQDVYDDYVTLRRYLIEHKFLERKSDGSQYWRNK